MAEPRRGGGAEDGKDVFSAALLDLVRRQLRPIE